MAQGKNKVILVGNMGKDPVMRETQNGKKVTSFSLAVSQRRAVSEQRAVNGQNDKVTWFEVSCWNGMAEPVAKFGAKGRQVYVEGSIELDDREHNGKRYVNLKVTANDVTFLDKKPNGAGNTSDGDTEPPADLDF